MFGEGTPIPIIMKDSWVAEEVLATTPKGLHLKHQIMSPKCLIDMR